jgi:hypothetical protein
MSTTTNQAPKIREVDKEEFARLCLDTAANREAIAIILWDIAGWVATKMKGFNVDDAQQAAYEKMLKIIHKVDAEKGEPFGFFFSAGLNAARTSRRKWLGILPNAKGTEATKRRAPRAAIITNISPNKIIATNGGRLRPVSDGSGRRRAKPAEVLSVIDVSLQRARMAMASIQIREKFDTDDPDYIRVETVIMTLQSLRLEVVGEYLTMRTPTVGYSAERVLNG